MGTCADCQFWATDDPDHAWAAPCDLGSIAKPEAWQSCSHFAARERTGIYDTPAQAQSDVRGPVPGMMGFWQNAWGKKP